MEEIRSKGKYIPKFLVTGVNAEQVLGLITYEEVKEDGRRAFSDVKKAIRDYKKTL